MNKYSEMSDFEINKLVVELLLNTNSIFMWTGNRYIQHQKIKSEDVNGSSVLVEYEFIGRPVTQNINFCDDTSQAMSLLLNSKMTLRPVIPNDTWHAIGDFIMNKDGSDGCMSSVHKNPCRAIAETYLLMKDAERGDEKNT